MCVLAACLVSSAANCASITSSPHHLVLKPDQLGFSVITWAAPEGAVVSVSADGDQERPFADDRDRCRAVYSGVKSPGFYVFKLYKDKSRKEMLAWTSITTQGYPLNRFGFHYVPEDRVADAYHDSVFVTLHPVMKRDLVEMSSLGCDVIRVMAWSFMGTSLDANGWRLDPEYRQTVRNMITFLRDCHDIGIRVDVAFANEFYTYGHHKVVDWDKFLEGSAGWINYTIDAIESDPVAREAVFCYDYQNEVHKMHDGIWEYVNYVYDHTRAPMGKRAISVSSKENIELLRANCGSRRFDYIDLHYYPDNQSGSDWDVEHWLSLARDLFSDSTVFVGEIGYRCDNPSDEPENRDAIMHVLDRSMAAGASARMLWNLRGSTDYKDPAKPKDLLGSVITANSLAPNADFEITHNGKPAKWHAEGVDARLVGIGPNSQGAAANDHFARLMGPRSKTVSAQSEPFHVRGGETLFANAMLRGAHTRSNWPLVRGIKAAARSVRHTDPRLRPSLIPG